jgi:hypothetical protein
MKALHCRCQLFESNQATSSKAANIFRFSDELGRDSKSRARKSDPGLAASS